MYYAKKSVKGECRNIDYFTITIFFTKRREQYTAKASFDVSCFTINIIFYRFIIYGVQVKENILDAKMNNGLCYSKRDCFLYNIDFQDI